MLWPDKGPRESYLLFLQWHPTHVVLQHVGIVEKALILDIYAQLRKLSISAAIA